MTINVALDIDQLLAFHHVNSLAQGKFFLKKGVVLTAYKTHYIYPGVIEFVRLLCLTPNIRVTFYSAATAARNLMLVPIILGLALPEPEYTSLKSQVRVLSREDLVHNKLNNWIDEFYYPDQDHISTSQKDLCKVLWEGDDIENAVLIDDQTDNIALHQSFNFIKAPVDEANEYDSLLRKTQFYDPQTGTRYLKCVINITANTELEEDQVIDGRRIFIYKNAENFEIKFIDLKGDIQFIEVPPIDELHEQLDYFYQKIAGLKEEIAIIGDDQVTENICERVSANNGRSRKICRRGNRICYIAGVLFSAIQLAQANNEPLRIPLAYSQFKVLEDNVEPRFHKSKKDDRFYLAGLQKLREVNPDYQLVTPHSYRTFTQMRISNDDYQLLYAAMHNEFPST